MPSTAASPAKGSISATDNGEPVVPPRSTRQGNAGVETSNSNDDAFVQPTGPIAARVDLDGGKAERQQIGLNARRETLGLDTLELIGSNFDARAVGEVPDSQLAEAERMQRLFGLADARAFRE